MRTAICFSGLVGSTKGKSQELVGDFKKCFEISSGLYKDHIFDKNDVDIFVHSWSTDLEQEILETYKPKKHIIEKQRVFEVPSYEILRKTPDVRIQTHYSLWYSRMMSAKLKAEYEQENNFKYDCVMLARFDLAWQTDLVFEKYNQDFFWTQRWPKKVLDGRMLSDVEYWQIHDKGYPTHTQWWGYPYNKHGLLGMWFFSNSKNIDKFVTMYDKLDEYSMPNRCPLDSAGNMSAHQQCLYHLKETDMLDKLKFCKNWHDDCPSVRRRYFRER
tara:strand:- start:445 stop:1260 length:816 start_codon:yes stop_codon:yes gene_type:complete